MTAFAQGNVAGILQRSAPVQSDSVSADGAAAAGATERLRSTRTPSDGSATAALSPAKKQKFFQLITRRHLEPLCAARLLRPCRRPLRGSSVH